MFFAGICRAIVLEDSGAFDLVYQSISLARLIRLRGSEVITQHRYHHPSCTWPYVEVLPRWCRQTAESHKGAEVEVAFQKEKMVCCITDYKILSVGIKGGYL